ncbi:hypothetical protein Cni_G11181 [Canna indica]|uniref:PB1 domain-containing protein n=1 Tax=Canna indica TaxID=4628 RepID=A0AAQ3K9Q5_9LILI|nr:hypothetical protein Cni_G11181 [Canna indica]
MVGTSSSSSSSSSAASFGCFDGVSVDPSVASSMIKFLCSYGGKILPRRPDGRLRYVGGHTRVLSVPRSISFSELQVKLRELCGWETVRLRCQLPTEDMDALVSVTSDEDLANLVEEYYRVGASGGRPYPQKIRAILLSSSKPSIKPPTTTPSPVTSVSAGLIPVARLGTVERCVHEVPVKLYSTTASAAVAAGKLCFNGRRHHRHPRHGGYIPAMNDQLMNMEQT